MDSKWTPTKSENFALYQPKEPWFAKFAKFNKSKKFPKSNNHIEENIKLNQLEQSNKDKNKADANTSYSSTYKFLFCLVSLFLVILFVGRYYIILQKSQDTTI